MKTKLLLALFAAQVLILPVACFYLTKWSIYRRHGSTGIDTFTFIREYSPGLIAGIVGIIAGEYLLKLREKKKK